MEVKHGYKQTELGVLPEGWSVIPFSELMGFQNGVNADKSAYGKGIRFINVLEPITYSHIDARHVKGRVSLSDTAINSYSIRKGDLVFNRTSETQEDIGLAAVYCGDEPVVFGGFVIRGRPKTNLIDPRYSGYGFRAPSIRSQIVARGQGAIRANVGQSDLKTILAPIPPRAEQEAIAEALSDTDALIESLEQLIAKKRQLKQGAMQELLTGKRRLPGFSGKWEVKRLGDCLIGSPNYGINAPAVPYSDLLPTYLRITDITDDGRFGSNTCASVNAANSDQYFLNEGDVVFARTGASVGKSYLYDSSDGQLVFAGFLIRVRPDPEKLLPGFLSAFATTTPYWNWVRLMSMRSGQPGINGSEYAQLPISTPPVSEQTAITAILSDMNDEIAALETKLAKARQIKQGMMQELLTGRIRLV